MLNEIVFFFVIGSILGFCLEIAFKSIARTGKISSGISFGPFCILYGFGTVILSLIVARITNNTIIQFIIASLILTVLEQLTGELLDKIYNIELWNYNKLKFKINKYVALEFSFAWGIVSLLYIKYILPVLNNIINSVNFKNISILFYMLIIIIVYDYIYSSILLFNIKKEKLKISRN